MRLNEVLAKIAEWHPESNTSGFDAFDFVHAFGSGREALLYAQLFWPEFLELDGMIFLSSTVETDEDKRRVNEAFKRYNSDVVKTEQSFNLVEIPYLFGPRIGETDETEDRWLAQILCDMWLCRLKTLFPTRSFHLEILEPEQTGGELGLIFYQAVQGDDHAHNAVPSGD